MTAVVSTVDPASRSASSWSASLAALKSRGVPETDARIIESLAALAFWRIVRAIEGGAGVLSPPGADRLVVMLREAARGGGHA